MDNTLKVTEIETNPTYQRTSGRWIEKDKMEQPHNQQETDFTDIFDDVARRKEGKEDQK